MDYIIEIFKNNSNFFREIAYTSDVELNENEISKIVIEKTRIHSIYRTTHKYKIVENVKDIPLKVFTYSAKWYSVGYTPSFTKCPNCDKSIGYHPKDIKCWSCNQSVIWN